MFSKLQYISQGATATEQLNNIKEALDAGCDWVQLRFKNAGFQELLPLAQQVKRLCADYSATFIINDHPEIAKETKADGVHLGLEDMSVPAAKEIIGDKIIGGTANTLEHVLQRVEEGCCYIGLGPFHFTTTKKKLSPILGLEGYARIMDQLAARSIAIPVYAIGGVVFDDIAAILHTRIYGVAVSGIITHHPEKRILIQQLYEVLV